MRHAQWQLVKKTAVLKETTMTHDEQRAVDDVKRYLLQIALELETASSNARAAAEAVPDQEKAWPHLQQLYTRLHEATHLIEQFQTTVNKAVSNLGPRT